MKTLDAPGTAAILPYAALVDALRRAATGAALGQINCPQRQVVAMPGDAAVLSMIAVGSDLAVHKLVTYVPTNPNRGLPTIQGQVSVWDATTGMHRLTLDGATVTGRRTAALSMLGIVSLLPHRPRAVRIIGTGTQARHHVAAVAALFPEARITVTGRTRAATEAFCSWHAKISASLAPASSALCETEVEVVIACTTSQEPVYTEPARAGRLLIAVGSFTPVAAEIAAETVRASQIYVDDLDSARHEAGDLIRAGVDWATVRPISQRFLDGDMPSGAVLFKTVGHAAWDLAAGRVAVASLGA